MFIFTDGDSGVFFPRGMVTNFHQKIYKKREKISKHTKVKKPNTTAEKVAKTEKWSKL